MVGAAAVSTGPAGSQLVLTWTGGYVAPSDERDGPVDANRGNIALHEHSRLIRQMFFRLSNP